MIRPFALALAAALLGATAPPSPIPSAAAPSAVPSPAAAPPAAPTHAPQPATSQPAHAHWALQGADDQTQRLVDRGLMMLYAFDVGEARVAFGAAVQRDPDLALGYWGEGEADTIDINLPDSAAGDERGAAAVAAGRRHLAHASVLERVLIDALGKRYGKGTKEQRFTRYAGALSAWTKTHRDDPNVLTVAAFAIWNAQDDLLDAHGTPTAKANEILTDLDDALKLEPTNLGAHHLRIHLLETIKRPQEAVADAEALESYGYPPGTSHLAHMPAHIWTRLGEYAKLVDDNERAVANDRAWFAEGNGPGQAYMHDYHDHDVDFVLYGLTTLGRDAEARAFAKNEDASMQAKVALRTHDDAAVLAVAPASATTIRGIAAARSGEVAGAKAERAKAGAAKPVAQALIDAALARHAGDASAEAAAYQRAYEATKNDGGGDPKDYWADPIGEGYGAALLAAKKPAQAETVFAAELKRFPNDPHLEFGLAEALAAQHKDDGVERAAYRQQWKGARDLTLADLG